VNNSNAETVLCQSMITRAVPNESSSLFKSEKADIESGGIMKTRIISIVIV